MNFHIVTLFPDSFSSYLDASILRRAISNKKIKVSFYNPIDFLKEKDRVDDKPYGGGPGMVMRAEPVAKAINKAIGKKTDYKIVFFTPSGTQFTNTQAKECVKQTKNIIFVCGRYEGIDARILEMFPCEKVSIGDYVLTGGELPAMIMIDAISRNIEGVLGDIDSVEENRISSPLVYTRPEVLKYKNKNYKVPDVLLSGNHKEIDKWREGQK
ncbi:MAG: tRNA ((1)-)-methyltransferase, tRNA (guanine37-N1)-methyltransferase [Candidatus Parcubacteria bacterium]|jgi:tRNA (guanine37-N1)-methyltransferase